MAKIKNAGIDSFVLSLGSLAALLTVSYAMMAPPIEENFRSFQAEPLAPRQALPFSPPSPLEDRHQWDPPVYVASHQEKSVERYAMSGQSQVQDGADPDGALDLVNSGVKLVDEGNWLEAEAFFLRALEKDPQNEAALVELAMIQLLDKKDGGQALPYLEKALALNPDNQTLIGETIAIYEQQGRPDDAVRFLKDLAEKNPGSDVLDYGMAQAMLRSGKPDEAVDYLQKAVEQQTGWEKDEVIEQLGDTHHQLGNHEAAIDSYQQGAERALQQADSHPEDRAFFEEQYVTNMIKAANIYAEKGDKEQAEEYFQQVEKNFPNHRWVKAFRQHQNDTSPY